MSAVAFASAGYVCPQGGGGGGGGPPVLDVVDPLVGTIAVPGPLVGRIDCENGGQALTDIVHGYGTSENYPLSWFEADGVTDLDITDAIVRLWVNDSAADRYDGAEIAARSYDAAEIEIVVPTVAPQAVWKVTTGDARFALGAYEWCAELTRKGTSRTSTGTISVVAGSGVITGAGLDTDAIEDGDYLLPAGTGAANQKPVVVELERDAAGAPTGNLVTDYTAWSTQGAFAFEVFVGDVKVAAGHSGSFTLTPC